MQHIGPTEQRLSCNPGLSGCGLCEAEELVDMKVQGSRYIEDIPSATSKLLVILSVCPPAQQASIMQLEREAALREAALKSRSDEVASLSDALRAAQAQCNQYLLDLQVGSCRVCMRITCKSLSFAGTVGWHAHASLCRQAL